MNTSNEQTACCERAGELCIICQERPATDSAGGDVVLCSPCAIELRRRARPSDCPSCNGARARIEKRGERYSFPACEACADTRRAYVPSR